MSGSYRDLNLSTGTSLSGDSQIVAATSETRTATRPAASCVAQANQSQRTLWEAMAVGAIAGACLRKSQRNL